MKADPGRSGRVRASIAEDFPRPPQADFERDDPFRLHPSTRRRSFASPIKATSQRRPTEASPPPVELPPEEGLAFRWLAYFVLALAALAALTVQGVIDPARFIDPDSF